MPINRIEKGKKHPFKKKQWFKRKEMQTVSLTPTIPCLSELELRSSTSLSLSFDPWVGKIPWRRKWQSTPGLWPGKSHGQRSLVGYSPWGRKESDTTERLHHIHYNLSEPQFSHQKMKVVLVLQVYNQIRNVLYKRAQYIL